MLGFFHIDKVISSIVEGMTVFVMTYLSEWGPSNEPVHGDCDDFAFAIDLGFGVPIIFSFDCSPGKLAKNIDIIFINYRYLSAG